MGCFKETIRASQPCIICGKPDYCFRLKFDNGGILHCCARKDDAQVLVGGEEYMLVKSKDTSIGIFNYYQSKTEYDAFIESIKGKKITPKCRASSSSSEIESPSKKIKGEVEVANDEQLDQVYRRFLSLLKLEKKDEEILRREWNSATCEGLFDKLISVYPVKSMAPADYIRKRKNYQDGYENSPRYKIVKQLVSEFGDLSGIPGFYKNDYGWNFSGTSGILFPIYNIKNQIIRLRLRESYPEIEGVFRQIQGRFTMEYDVNGNRTWLFTSTEENSKGRKILVYSSSEKLIGLKSDGCPQGKASSKYKNFSSVFEKKLEDGSIVNGYGIGCRSGSNISIYTKPGDDWSVIYITEGEKKAMVANMLLNVPVISLPGTGTFGKLFEKNSDGQSIMDLLVEKGMKLCVIAYDADKNTNIRVMQSETKAIMEFLKRGIKIAVGEWNPEFGKGLDDILVYGIRPSIYLCT